MKTLCLSLWFALTVAAQVTAQTPATTGPETAASGGVCPDCKMDLAKCGDQDAKPAPVANDKDEAAKRAEVEKAVVDLETKWCEAQARHDVAFIEKIEADDYVYTDATGKMTTKQEEVAEAKQGGNMVPFKLSDMKAHVYGDTVVLTGQTSFTSADAESAPVTYRWTDVFVRRSNGEWQVVASHASSPSSSAGQDALQSFVNR